MFNWSNWLQKPNDFCTISPIDRSVIPVIKPNLSMSAPQIQGGINAPQAPASTPSAGLDPAVMMSLASRFGGNKQMQIPQMPAPQMPQAQAPTGTFSGLSPFAPRANPQSQSIEDFLKKSGLSGSVDWSRS